jgi:hypothetical protein
MLTVSFYYSDRQKWIGWISYYKEHGNYNKAIVAYRGALTKEIATTNERLAIEDKIKDCEKAIAATAVK